MLSPPLSNVVSVSLHLWNWIVPNFFRKSEMGGPPNVVRGFTTPVCRHQDYNNDPDNLSEMNNTVPHKKRGTKLPLLHPAPASEKFKTFQLVHFLTVFFGGVWFQILPETENLETYYICTSTPTNRPQVSPTFFTSAEQQGPTG